MVPFIAMNEIGVAFWGVLVVSSTRLVAPPSTWDPSIQPNDSLGKMQHDSEVHVTRKYGRLSEQEVAYSCGKAIDSPSSTL